MWGPLRGLRRSRFEAYPDPSQHVRAKYVDGRANRSSCHAENADNVCRGVFRVREELLSIGIRFSGIDVEARLHKRIVSRSSSLLLSAHLPQKYHR